MPADPERIRRHLQRFDFEGLFIEELGWDHPQGSLPSIKSDEYAYDIHAIAEKRGFVAYRCGPDGEGEIPDHQTRRKIERQVRKHRHEHTIIYVDAAEQQLVWQWVKYQHGKPPQSREQSFRRGQTGQALVERLREIAFDLSEEQLLTLTDVESRFGSGFDVDRVTKKFYDRFKKEHDSFLKFIKGIPDEDDCRWYASVMLNRLMFVYFIQRRGFLAGDTNYLRNRLQAVQQKVGQDRFHSFYRDFLIVLFHDGLGRQHPRPEHVDDLIGDVPYLNGGLFDPHEIERKHDEIEIPDEAFEAIFNFFDSYQWHLDTRSLEADNEINPDVLGYIFEKYINQKEMGAYYTKEDITDYICRNTIIPYLFDAAKRDCKIAFRADGPLWGLLRENPDEYIYDAVSHGADLTIPTDIAVGIDDISKRCDWNTPAADGFALPAETWREHIARRQRYEEIWENIVDGEITSIDDLITYNLDIKTFAQDVIESCEGPELLRAFYRAIKSVSVLDPACGSGAFLFAALSILEPLYGACLDRMQTFIDDFERSEPGGSPQRYSDFRRVLDEVERHPSRSYFILKSIVINNLYGVDIMDEAIEICKLRLFLKLVAQIDDVHTLEPLPDIDFNVRPGNTLIGFVTLPEVRRALTIDSRGNARLPLPDDMAALEKIKERAESVDAAYLRFRAQQTRRGDYVHSSDKRQLRLKLNDLGANLDVLSAKLYGIAEENLSPPEYQSRMSSWKDSHRPFHWVAEFYGVVSSGGFNVIIGNPPYVPRTTVQEQFEVLDLDTWTCPDIYAMFIERSMQLRSSSGRFGMILPISFQFSDRFEKARDKAQLALHQIWVSTFSRNPAALFTAGLGVRSTICIGSAKPHHEPCIWTSKLQRWVEEFRPQLFQSIQYNLLSQPLQAYGWPRIHNPGIAAIFSGLVSNHWELNNDCTRGGPYELRFKTTGLYYISTFISDPPSFDKGGNPIDHSDIGSLSFPSTELRDAALTVLLGKLSLIWWAATGDDFHITRLGLGRFPLAVGDLPEALVKQLYTFADDLQAELSQHVIYTKYAGKWMGNYDVKYVRHITDQTDKLLLRALGLEALWEDVELAYDGFMKATGERPGTIRELPNFEN